MSDHRPSRSSKTLKIRNMVCSCCCRVLKTELESKGLQVNHVEIGMAEVEYDEHAFSIQSIQTLLSEAGFDLITSKEEELTEQIKHAVVELVHHYNYANSLIRNSDFIVEKLGYNYSYLSKLFSENESMTLEKYIILQKIEKVKEMLYADEMSLSEIAFQMGYSSVQYLSTQFKKICGQSITEFRKTNRPGRIAANSA